jgi:hypothetical protein
MVASKAAISVSECPRQPDAIDIANKQSRARQQAVVPQAFLPVFRVSPASGTNACAIAGNLQGPLPAQEDEETN